MIKVKGSSLEISALDRISDDALVAMLFSDDRPPRGLAGLIDWRTDGMISRMSAKGRITGDFEECVLFATKERTSCGFILFIGLGRRRELTNDRLHKAGNFMLKKLKAAGVKRFAFSIPLFENGITCWGDALGILLQETIAASGWDQVTVLGETDRIKKIILALPPPLKSNIAFTTHDSAV